MGFDYTEDLEENIVPSDDAISNINKLALLQLDLEAEVADIENKLSAKQAALRKVSEVELPEAMRQAGVEDLKLTNGARVKLHDDLKISVPKTKLPFVCNWLRKNKHDDIIKREVVVDLPKGTDPKLIKDVEASLTKLKVAFSTELNVHSGTLKALIKEQREKGTFKAKLEEFGAYEYRAAKITLPKNTGEK